MIDVHDNCDVTCELYKMTTVNDYERIKNSTFRHYIELYPSDSYINSDNDCNRIANIMNGARSRDILKPYLLKYGELTSQKIDTWGKSILSITKKKRKRNCDNNKDVQTLFINVRESFDKDNTSHIVIDEKLYNNVEKRHNLLNKINESTNLKCKDFHEIMKKNILLVKMEWIYEMITKEGIIDHSTYVIHTEDGTNNNVSTNKDETKNIIKLVNKNDYNSNDDSFSEIKDHKEGKNIII